MRVGVLGVGVRETERETWGLLAARVRRWAMVSTTRSSRLSRVYLHQIDNPQVSMREREREIESEQVRECRV